MEFINIELFGSTRTGKRNFQRHAGVRFVYACFAVRAGNRAGVKYLEEPSPLDNTSDDADGTRIFSKWVRSVQILHIQHTTHELLFYEYV